MRVQRKLENVHKKVITKMWMKYLAAITRGMLAIGFIIPGMVKVQQIPFTNLPVTNPVGYFFDAFFQASEYYFFIGLIQVLAGVCLLFPATTALGAALYFPVILNIFIVTVAIQFKGTWAVALLMMIGAFFLLLWEFDKWKGFIPGFSPVTEPLPSQHLGFFKTAILTLGSSAVGFGLFMLIRIFL